MGNVLIVERIDIDIVAEMQGRNKKDFIFY